MTDARLVRLLWLSIGAAVGTITLKVLAWSLTGSVVPLSNAAESVVNLVAAVVALLASRARSSSGRHSRSPSRRYSG